MARLRGGHRWAGAGTMCIQHTKHNKANTKYEPAEIKKKKKYKKK